MRRSRKWARDDGAPVDGRTPPLTRLEGAGHACSIAAAGLAEALAQLSAATQSDARHDAANAGAFTSRHRRV